MTKKEYHIVVKGKVVDIDYYASSEHFARSFLESIIKDVVMEDISIKITGPPAERIEYALSTNGVSNITFCNTSGTVDTTGTLGFGSNCG